MSYLLGIETANPQYCLSQEQLAGFYSNVINEHDEHAARKIRIVAGKSGIKQRYTVIGDYGRTHDAFTFFPQNPQLEPLPGLSERMALYRTEALKLSLDAINKIKNFASIKDRVTHIITVTCTGMFAPGLDIELMKALELKPSIHRASINFMGCNAAILAIKQANQICKSDLNALVLIVCTELCTIHFQKQYTDDYILSNLIFSDGAAAAIVSAQKQLLHDDYTSVKILSFQSMIIHEGHHDMAWRLSENGFIMNLTSYVSCLINKNIPEVLREMGITPDAINHWAIHPGGKKILDDFRQTMNMHNGQLAHSYAVLEEYGNMSSPTVLFVLQKLLSSKQVVPNDTIYAAAFGPGLSIESTLLQYD